MKVEEQEAVVSESEEKRASGMAVELPKEYGEYAVFVDVLRANEVMDYLLGVVLERRAGAYELVDLVLFLGCFFSASVRGTSIAEFAESSAVYRNELAGIGGRIRWLTQSSASRELASVGDQSSRDIAQRLLEVTARSVVQSKLATTSGYRDGAGNQWWVMHWDTTVEGVRKRALPEGDELPDGIRLSDELAKPGYGGRKRGEAVFARSIVSDATSGAWIHMDLCSGSGSVRDQIKRAVDATVAFVGECGEELGKTVMVCDGVGGGMTQTRAVLSGGLHIVTRNAQYELLQTKAAQKIMDKSKWLLVEDSRSGPRREAIDLGTRVVDGFKVRIIASRFRRCGSKKKQRGAGFTIGEYHYELFLTSFPTSGWAANDVVTLYYGRTAIENRFAAEDREFDLARVFSFSKSGQLLACAVAMTLWNLRIATGLASVPETAKRRDQRSRMPNPTEEHTPAATVNEPVDYEPEHRSEPKHDNESEHEHPTLASVLGEVDMNVRERTEHWCATHPGWNMDGQTLRCPKGRPLSLKVRPRNTNLTARYRVGTCVGCDIRSQCMPNSSNGSTRKEVKITLFKLDCLQAHNQNPPESENLTEKPQPSSLINPAFVTLTHQPHLPPLLPDAPILLPAVLRKHAKKLFASCRLDVLAPVVQYQDEDLDDHIASDQETRQRRRLTIAQRVQANARTIDQETIVALYTSAKCAHALSRLKNASRSA
jgi:hypothetical protein